MSTCRDIKDSAKNYDYSPISSLRNTNLAFSDESFKFKLPKMNQNGLSTTPLMKCRTGKQRKNTTEYTNTCDLGTDSMTKSMKSMSVYKGPVAKSYSINSPIERCSPKKGLQRYDEIAKCSRLTFGQYNTTCSVNSDSELSPILRNCEPTRHTVTKDYVEFTPKSCTETPLTAYKTILKSSRAFNQMGTQESKIRQTAKSGEFSPL